MDTRYLIFWSLDPLLKKAKNWKLLRFLYRKFYLKSKSWKRRSTDIKKQAGHICFYCHKIATNNLDVHHLNYEHLGDEQLGRDVVVACRNCHEVAERLKKGNRWKRY